MPAVELTRAGPVLTITLNRPDVLNAFDASLHSAFRDALETAADPAVRAVVITGAGRGFCVGQDLGEFRDGARDVAEQLRTSYHPNVLAIRALEKPVIAAVNGPAAGAGLSLACACDIRIAADSASFVPAFINIGLVPDSGGTYFVRRLLGFARAFEWLATGRRLTAAEALQWGLVSEVVEADRLPQRAAELAAELAALPTRGIWATKRALDNAENATLAQQLELEATLQAQQTRTEDFKEGVAAFLEKRPAAFTGRPLEQHPVAVVATGDRQRWRLTVLLRYLLAYPHLIVASGWQIVASLVALVGWFILLVRGRLPRGVHEFLARYVRYHTHVYAYLNLMADPYPSFRGWPGTYPVDLEIAPPQPQSRWKTAFRIVLAIPAFVLATVLTTVLNVVAILGWFIALALGRIPKGMQDLGIYCLRYYAQTFGYLLLLTDRYPSLASGLTAEGELTD